MTESEFLKLVAIAHKTGSGFTCVAMVGKKCCDAQLCLQEANYHWIDCKGREWFRCKDHPPEGRVRCIKVAELF